MFRGAPWGVRDYYENRFNHLFFKGQILLFPALGRAGGGFPLYKIPLNIPFQKGRLNGTSDFHASWSTHGALELNLCQIFFLPFSS
jgi:hypothetical protein